MCSNAAFQTEADLIQWIVDEVQEHLDGDAETWNARCGILQFAGEQVRFRRGPDILTLTVRGQEVMLLR